MTQEQLTRLLHERTADEPVGPPPLADMHRAAVRRRRGRRAVLGAAASLVLVAGALAVLDGPAAKDDGVAPAIARPATDPELPPEGYRWVGVGHAAIAVPEDWGTNATDCGTPTRDTVIVDQGVVCAALFPFPRETTSIEVRPRYEGEPGDTTDATGEPPRLGGLECQEGRQLGAATCRQTLVLPAEDAMITVESSRGRAAVAAALARVTILKERVAVPGFSLHAFTSPDHPSDAYRRVLQESGFVVVERLEDGGGLSAGSVLGAEPAPGTMLEPGSTVTITVARP